MVDVKLINLLLLLILISNVDSLYIYMKPYSNEQCSGNSDGVGYIINVNSECMPLSSNSSGGGSGLKVNVLGLIGLFEFYDNINCTSGSNQYNDAFKHNQCYQLPSILNFNFDKNNQDDSISYFMISFLSNVNQLPSILNQEYGLKKFQYSNSDNNNNCNDTINFQYVQLITNNFNITNSNNNEIDTIYCDNNNNPYIKQCINNQCTTTSLSIDCVNNINQTC